MLRTAMALALAFGVALSWSGAVPVQAAPKNTDTVVLVIDRPAAGETVNAPGALGGWAIDQTATANSGIDSIAIYMDGDQATGQFLGMAELGGARADVAAQFGPQFANAGWNFNLFGEAVPAGQHTFTAVAHSGVSGMQTTAAVSPVTFVSSQPVTMAPPPPPAMGMQSGSLQVSATLSDVNYLFGQNYYSSLNGYNGYLYPGLVLPNGDVIDTGTTVDNGQIQYRGNFMPIGTFLTPAYSYPNLYSGSYSYGTRLPGGNVVPYGAGYNYWSNYNWGLLNTAAPNQSEATETNDVITFNPYGAGFRLGLQLPPAPSQLVGGVPAVPGNGAFLSPGLPNAIDPGTGQVINPGNGLVQTPSGQIVQTNPNLGWQSYNFSGTSAMQANLVARVTVNGQPVQGAQVSYMGMNLPPTDANGMTHAMVLYPINPTGTIDSQVMANYNGMTASIPLILSWNQ